MEDLLKGGTYVPPELRLPDGASKKPDWTSRLSSSFIPSNGPRVTPTPDTKPYVPASWERAHAIAASEGLHLPGPHLPPQGMWTDDEIMPYAEAGYKANGHRWYRQYNGNLTRVAAGSGIHPARVMDTFGITGQGSSVESNLINAIKVLSRHRSGAYSDPKAFEEANKVGIAKPLLKSEPTVAAMLKAIHGQGIDTKKLSAYAGGFRDSDVWHPHESPYGQLPPSDEWMGRLHVGGDAKHTGDDVAHAITGRQRSFIRDAWEKAHPEAPMNGTMMQAMLWTGYKREIARHLHEKADYIEAHHSDHPLLMGQVKRLRMDAETIGDEGTVDDLWKRYGIDEEKGLPASASHDILAKYLPDLLALEKTGAVHSDYHNLYVMNLPGKPGASVEDKEAALARWQESTGEKWGSVTKDGHLILPKRTANAHKKTLLASGISILGPGGGVKRQKPGPAKVTNLDPDAIAEFIHSNPERAHALATLPKTARHLESLEKKAKKAGQTPSTLPRLLWSDYGAFTAHIGALAEAAGYGSIHPEPIFHGGFKGERANGHDYSAPKYVPPRGLSKAVGGGNPADDRGAGGGRGAGTGQGGDVRGRQNGRGGDGGSPDEGVDPEPLSLPKRTAPPKPLPHDDGPDLPPAVRAVDDALAMLSQIESGIGHAQRAISSMAETLHSKLPGDADHAYLRGALSVIADHPAPPVGDWGAQ